MLGNRRRGGELASGSLPFTVTGDQFSAPLTTTGWGPGRYAARASAGPIRNSILSDVLSNYLTSNGVR